VRKVYCFPIVLDTNLCICKLVGNRLFVKRFPLLLNFIGSESKINKKISKYICGFEEVSPKEFTELAQKQVSYKGIKAFEKKFKEIYK
jgi:hypothetical protein